VNDEPRKRNPADAFRAMADSIERNPDMFAGAVLIVPPLDEEVVEMLLVSTKPELDTFWGAAQARLKIELAKLEDRQRQREIGWATR
jgi:hypothetical protein